MAKKPKKPVVLLIRLAPELKAQIVALAVSEGRTVASQVRIALREHLEK